ncbi:MAG: hypothetical protein ACYDHT_00620 [Solirubrobacteraceae bacterium]
MAAMACSVTLAGVLPWFGQASHAASAGGEPTAQTDDSVPASNVTMIGATPAEANGGRNETWGIGAGASGPVLVRYEHEAGWSLGPALQDEGGQPLAGFEVDTPEAFSSHSGPSPLAGQMTADGAGVLAGSVQQGKQQVLLVRDPNNPANPFRETKPLPEGMLEGGERLLGLTRAPLIAALDQGGGHAEALVVPVRERGVGAESRVLSWNGETQEWSSESIELPASASASEFRVLGIGASSPANAWLLAQVSSERVALFTRQIEGTEASWHAVAVKPGGEAGEPLAVRLGGGEEPLAIPGAQRERVQTQVLTVTSQGVWIDGERPEVRASTTMYFKPEVAGSGPSLTSWCTIEASAPGTEACEHPLPMSLPTGPSRSIAWASSSTPFGERVITGFPEGETLRLDGESFTPVLGLGGSGSQDEGATYGAAFSSSREGWLGNFRLPVHLTLEPAASRLTPWPVSFRHALLAVAPKPGAAIGSLSSEAVAVGDEGEVARFQPGEGWLPESLFGAGGRRSTPRLRAVAWPTAGRIYAVGDAGVNESPMWLWRGETGLWEPDPAAPYNFRGNLLGIAFDPNNPARGYAVGESGVLLGYGKTWSQEPYPAESPCPHSSSARCTWANAGFTSIAFSGSEAIVAYRILPDISSERYEGGLLTNSGSGWHVDRGAAEAMGSNVPWAVAGLPDGGAAFGASHVVYERQGSTAPWQATATPFPGASEPGTLAPFREGGAMRVVAAGSVPDTSRVEREPEAPPGSPPTLIKPYPLASHQEAGVVRQTAGGWSDEEHEQNNAQEPEGNWTYYDEVYQPDPISAVLIDPSGSQGWAVGGYVEPEEHEGGPLDTADVDRYPSDGVTPLGVGTSPIGTEAAQVTFAIGGNAQCAAPCADRANAKIGPDVWLASALSHAHIPGVQGFIYTGPRLVSPHATNGPKESVDTISYGAELGRYAQILHGGSIPGYVAATPTDLDEAGSEVPFDSTFAPFTELPAGQIREQCKVAECQSAYYAFTAKESNGNTVRVIVLDDSAEPDQAQVEWLEGELREARAFKQPAIAVGNADLAAEIAAGNHPRAAVVAQVLVNGAAGAPPCRQTGCGSASAYFFDSPEENVKGSLTVGKRGEEESIPTFGSGTLGYVKSQNEANGAFLGASGFMLTQTETTPDRVTNRAHVSVRLIPNIGELALEGKSGTLLRRSQAARFVGLARRMRAGNRSAGGGSPAPETSPYIPIPSNCVGAACASGVFPEYSFSSSNPQVGHFVKANEASANPLAVLYDATGKPVEDEKPEPGHPQSGLFCALNPGTTIVTIKAGGLSASLPVTIQAGSVRQPCGTTPLSELPSKQQSVPVPPPAPAPAPASAAPSSSPTPLLPVPPAPAAILPKPPGRVTPAPPPFFVTPALTGFVPAILPPPIPTPARPTPPSGTSAVTSPVEAPEREEEQEAAPESVSAEAVAYRSTEHEPSPVFILGAIVLAAFAGASVRRRPRRGRRDLRVAPATISAMRSQRRNDPRRDRRF